MEIEGRSRKKWIYLGGVQNHIFLYHHCCRLRQLSSREVYTPDLFTGHFSLNVNTIQNIVYSNLAQASKLRNANLEMQYKNRIKLRSIVKER